MLPAAYWQVVRVVDGLAGTDHVQLFTVDVVDVASHAHTTLSPVHFVVNPVWSFCEQLVFPVEGSAVPYPQVIRVASNADGVRGVQVPSAVLPKVAEVNAQAILSPLVSDKLESKDVVPFASAQLV